MKQASLRIRESILLVLVFFLGSFWSSSLTGTVLFGVIAAMPHPLAEDDVLAPPTPPPIPQSPPPLYFDATTHSAWKGCHEVLQRIRNQGSCTSCWAIAPADVLRDRLCIQEFRRNNGAGLFVNHLEGTSHAVWPNISVSDVMMCNKFASTRVACTLGGRPQQAWAHFQITGYTEEDAFDPDHAVHEFAYRFRPCNHSFPFTSSLLFDRAERIMLLRRSNSRDDAGGVVLDPRWERIVRATWALEGRDRRTGLLLLAKPSPAPLSQTASSSSSSLASSSSKTHTLLPYCRRLANSRWMDSGKPIVGDDIHGIANNFDHPQQQQRNKHIIDHPSSPLDGLLSEEEDADELLDCPPHGVDGRKRTKLSGITNVGDVAEDGSILQAGAQRDAFIQEELYAHGPVQAVMTLYPNLVTLPRMPPLPHHGVPSTSKNRNDEERESESDNVLAPMFVYRCDAKLWQRRNQENPRSMYTQRRHHAVRIVGWGTALRKLTEDEVDEPLKRRNLAGEEEQSERQLDELQSRLRRGEGGGRARRSLRPSADRVKDEEAAMDHAALLQEYESYSLYQGLDDWVPITPLPAGVAAAEDLVKRVDAAAEDRDVSSQAAALVHYWIVANSLGPEWGAGGFFFVERGAADCRITQDVVAPDV